LRRQADSMQGEERAMAAIVLQLAGEKKQARSLMQKFHTLLAHPDGTYLAYPSGSFTSIDRKIQRHVQLMEAVSLVEPEDTTLMQGMQEWLLQQKRTQEWERPMQTADAVYALLLRPEGDTYIAEAGKDDARFSSPLRDVLQLQDGRKTATLQSPETSLGYLRQRVEDVKSPRTLNVKKQTDGLSWGAVYAQYQMPASEVEAQTEGLRIERTVESQKTAVGDRIHVRYVVTADRDYEYVRLAAPRPAAAEPESQHSGYRWHDGLGYYVAQHDASTEYFIDRLPRGTYVIEEDWLTAHAGAYTLAPALLQCLYAPEFQAHTAGGKITVVP
ncbi:MAG: alpha-2-macroglobulin, partial [Bacteroidaceae bacterium]|nr:alpha-2-macroglobulin [Bacteroidaceae bacterium]